MSSAKTKRVALAAGLLLLSHFAHAAEPEESPSPLRLFGRAAYSAGGAKIASGTYVNTGNNYDVTTGGGATFAIGAEMQLSDAVSVQVTTGRQTQNIDATNGDLKLSRNPQEAIVFYQFHPKWKVGAGVRQDKNLDFSWRHDTAGSGSRKLDAGTGKVIDVQYLFSPREKKSARSLQAGLSLHLIQQNYTDSLTQTRYGANQVGIGVFFYY